MIEPRQIVAEQVDTYLVLQGLSVSRASIDAIARSTQAQRIENPTPNVFKLLNAQPDPDLSALCRAGNLDFAFVSAAFKLVAMDMDSTVVNIETLDEIADFAGLKQEIAAITDRSMNGAVDFAESLRQRVALLRGLDATALEKVYAERLALSPGAEQFIAALKRHGIKTMLVSGGFTFFTERLRQRLDLDFAFANELEIVDGKLTGALLGPLLDPAAKAVKVRQVCDVLEIAQPGRVIAVGDGANDRAMFDAVGTGIGFRPRAVLRSHARYCIDYVGMDGIANLFS
jgi:phosphoserine phosphatase